MPTEIDPAPIAPNMAGARFEPTARQVALYRTLLQTPPDGLSLVGYGGAMGGGKTRAIVELAIDTALGSPGTRVLIARQQFSNLQTTTMDEFFACCPDDLIAERRRASPQWVGLHRDDWPPGLISQIHFRHLSEWSGLGSEQYGAVFIDEAGEVSEAAVQMLLTRLRHPAQSRRWLVAASNPWPGWFERWFVRRELPEEALAAAGGVVRFIPARVEDNPHLPPQYAAQQRALLPGEWVSRFIDGRFDAFSGLIYGEFDPQRHLWRGPLPTIRRWVGGLDFGGQSPFDHDTAGVVAGLTASDVLIRVAEFEDHGPGVTERLEQWMTDQERRWGAVQWRADRSQSAWIDHMRRRGRAVRASRGGPDSVAWGIALVQSRLRPHQQRPEIGPRSRYLPELRVFAERMREYQWQAPVDGQPPRPLKRRDDLLDADRYMHEAVDGAAAPGPQAVRLRVAARKSGTGRRARPALSGR